MVGPDAKAMAESSRRSRLFWTLARIAVTVGALSVLFAITDMKSVAATLRTFPLQAAFNATALAFGALGIGAVRWMVLMRTCGATHTPPLTRLYRLSLVGFFYSTVLPGAVGGDVIRGLATAESFEGRGATASLAVTLLERLSGLAGLMVIAGCAFLLNPLEGVEGLRMWGAVGFVVALIGTGCAAFGAKLAPLFRGRLGTLAAQLPDVKRPSGLALALFLSLGTQVSVILAGHTLVAAVYPDLSLFDSAVVMPVVSVAGYFPLTVAGAGAREAVLVGVYRLVGVPEEKSLAAALALLGCSLIVAATGGIVNLLKPLK